MVSWIRVGVRLLLIGLLTFVFWSLLFIGYLMTLPWPRYRARWREFIFKNWSAGLLWILGVKVKTLGEPPQHPFLMISNHLSYIDIPVIASHVGVVFIAKEEIASWPLVGLVCKSVNTIFIDRGVRGGIPRVLEQIQQELELGAGIVLFAEGTSSNGESVMPFRPSLLEVAAQTEMPVSFAALSYDTPEDAVPAHLAVCWWGGRTFGRHLIGLLKLRRIAATLTFGEQRIQDRDRKELAHKLRMALLDNFQPTKQPS